MMASIGIVKDKPFEPDETEREILDKAATVALKIAEALNLSTTAIPDRLSYEGKRRWFNAYSGVDDKVLRQQLPEPRRAGDLFMIAYSSASYMNIPTPGLGARYPSTYWDADGDYLVGDNTYKLHLPPGIPAGLFWSVTAYNPVDGIMIDAGRPFPSINSLNEQVAQQPDESVELYAGPEKPTDAPEANWIKTNPGAPRLSGTI